MTRAGRGCRGMLLIALLLPTLALALEASVDRFRVNLGDSLQLTLRSSGTVDPAEVDLAPLTRDFDILQRSTRSSTRVVNGRTTRERTLELELTPLREGTLAIPPLAAGGERTAPLTIEVAPAPAPGDPDAEVLFSAEVDRTGVYVQQQLLLTLRIQQAIALDDRSVTELAVDGAFVKPLGQNSFQRNDGNRRWLVHELRYALFPEESGTLTIPAQTFTGRVRQGSRSLFDRRSGPRLTRRTEPLRIDVRPQPAAFPGDSWLPAEALTLEESWSQPPEALATGESVTRTVTVTGSGLQGAQLPPLRFEAQPGLKYYPDQPQIEDAEGAGGVVGVRTDSAAIVPVAPGTYELPAIRIPWWDTAADRLRYATLPGRRLQVAAGAAADASADGAAPDAVAGAAAPRAAAAGWWPVLAAVFAAGWLATGGLWWWYGRRRRSPQPETAADPREAAAWKALRAAMARREPAPCRQYLAAWLRTLPQAPAGASLRATAASLDAPELAAAIEDLDGALFAREPGRWNPASLERAAQALRRRRRETRGDGAAALPPLYPDGGAPA